MLNRSFRFTTKIQNAHEMLHFHISDSAPSGWDDFVNEEGGNFFLAKDWNDVLRKGFTTPSIYAFLLEGEKIILGISGTVFNLGFIRLFFSQVPYGGFIGDAKYIELFLGCLEKGLAERGVHQIRIARLGADSYPDLPGYTQKKACQYGMDLQGKSINSLWEGYRKNTRRDVSRAKRLGVTVREIKNRAELKVYYQLYQQTMKRNASICHYTLKLYEAIYDEFVCSGRGSLLFSEYEGKIVAGAILLFGDDVTYLLGHVSDPEYLKKGPNDLLYQRCITDVLERNHQTFDLMTCDLHDEKLMFFKQKWGAEQCEFSIFLKSISPIRCYVWSTAWKLAQSKLGRYFVSIFFNRA